MNTKKIVTLMALVAFAAPVWGSYAIPEMRRNERIGKLINAISDFNRDPDQLTNESLKAVNFALFVLNQNDDCKHLKLIDKQRIDNFINELYDLNRDTENATLRRAIKESKTKLHQCAH